MSTKQKLNINEIWESALKEIRSQISETNFDTWFKASKAMRLEGEKTLVIGVSNDFIKNWLEKKYTPLISDEINKRSNFIKSIKITVSKKVNQTKYREKEIIASIPLQLETVNKSTGLSPRNTFKDFIIAPYIQFAHAAAQAVVDRTGTAYNPLFIFGSTGVGKTHLIQSIGNKKISLNPNTKAFYVTADEYAEDFLAALAADKIPEFRKRYQSYQVLIIDDVHFFATRTRMLIELCHLFNHMYNNNHQIIFASDRHPSELEGIEDRIKSRFASGMVMEIPPPDIESLSIILKKKAELKGIFLDNEIIEYIVKNINGNIREIEGIIKNLMLYNEINNKPINLINVKSFLRSNLKPKIVASYKSVIEKVCDFYEIEINQITAKCRKKEIVNTRQIIMYFLREYMDMSYSLIGKRLGNRDHTTVMHACEKIQLKLENDAKLQQEVIQIKKLINI